MHSIYSSSQIHYKSKCSWTCLYDESRVWKKWSPCAKIAKSWNDNKMLVSRRNTKLTATRHIFANRHMVGLPFPFCVYWAAQKMLVDTGAFRAGIGHHCHVLNHEILFNVRQKYKMRVSLILTRHCLCTCMHWEVNVTAVLFVGWWVTRED